MRLRLLSGLILLLAVLWLPFWFSLLLILISMVYFSFFIEGVIFITLNEVLYGVSEAKFHNEIFVWTGTFLVILFVIEYLKKKLEFHSLS